MADADARDAWVENPPQRRVPLQRARELWGARELVYFLALRDLKARYKQAAFGFGWAVLQPLAGAIVFGFVFYGLADVPSQGIPYLVFALVGFIGWTYFASSLNAATNSLMLNTSMITKVYFPRIASPVASLFPGLVTLGVGLLVLAVTMALYGVAPGPQIVTFPFWVAFAVLAALGPGLLLATLYVKYRDVAVVIGLLTQLWLLISPIAYPSSLVEGNLRWVYALNPVAGLIDGFRWSLVDGPSPWPYALVSLASAIVMGVAGWSYFHRAERRFADVI